MENMFAANDMQNKKEFIRQLERLNTIYFDIFSKLEQKHGLTEENIKSLDDIKAIDLVLYHFTLAFIYDYTEDYLEEEWSNQAMLSYELAQLAYKENKAGFDAFRRKFVTFNTELVSSYKNQLFKSISNTFHEDTKHVLSYDKLESAIGVLRKSVTFLEDPYQKKGYEVLEVINSTNKNGLIKLSEFDINTLASVYELLAQIYHYFKEEKYDEMTCTMEDFSEMKMTDQNDEALSNQANKKSHLLLHNLMYADDVSEFIKSMSVIRHSKSEEKNKLSSMEAESTYVSLDNDNARYSDDEMKQEEDPPHPLVRPRP